jgi:hypothetical protein
MDDEDNHRQVPLLRRRGFVFDRELLSVSILSSDVSMASLRSMPATLSCIAGDCSATLPATMARQWR